MDLNAERHFSAAPMSNIEHSTFDRPYDWTCSINAGVLNCFYWDLAVPGDIYNIKTSQLTRMTTPIFPVCDRCFLDVAYFFVPWYLIFDKTKEFFGENTATTGDWIPSVTYTIPNISTLNLGTRVPGDLAHQMGIPLNITAGGIMVNSLPFRAVRLVWNEFYRDQQTMRRKLLNIGSSNDTDSTLNSLYPVCRIHDMFGSLCPKPQYSNDTVNIGIEGLAPVITQTSNWASSSLNTTGLRFTTTASAGLSAAPAGNLGIGASGAAVDTTGTNTNTNGVIPWNLAIDAAKTGSSLSIDVNTLRESVAMQRIFEKQARFGQRYSEFLRGIFHVIDDDLRLQRPEFLGGERWILNMADNVQTSASVSGQTPISTVSGWSKTVGSGAQFSFACRSHGYVMGFCYIRRNRSYSQGISAMWRLTGMFSVYNPSLAHIGEQPVRVSEIYAAAVQPNNILGYQEAWYYMRYSPSRNCGLMDPGSSTDGSGNPTGLGAYWTYGDWYSSAPVLDDTFMSEGNAEIQRTLAVQNEDQFIVNIHVDNKHVRPMPMYSVPGLVDHF